MTAMNFFLKLGSALMAVVLTGAACSAQRAANASSSGVPATAASVPEHNSDAAITAKPESAKPVDVDGRVLQVGGSVHPPVSIYRPNPKYTRDARAARFSGKVVVAMIVGTDGKPRNVHILRGAGMGLDEEALNAVNKYRFEPATQDGKPVAVYVNVEVNFQILP
jgi:TonB family protein